MSRPSEARFWQVAGLLAGMAGVVLVGWVTYRFGLASINPTALAQGLAAGFILLTAVACFVAGRALQVEETVLTPGESVLWALLAIVATVSGAAALIFTATKHSLFSIDRFVMGLAGGFSMIMGVICLLGHRVMAHMRGMYTGEEEVQKHAASA